MREPRVVSAFVPCVFAVVASEFVGTGWTSQVTEGAAMHPVALADQLIIAFTVAMVPGLVISAYGLRAPTWLEAGLAALGVVSFAPELGRRKSRVVAGAGCTAAVPTVPVAPTSPSTLPARPAPEAVRVRPAAGP